MIICPKCKYTDIEEGFEVAIRQGDGIIDVGFRCVHCGHEFGFEYFTDERRETDGAKD
jgi:RNase P subunit RPR2